MTPARNILGAAILALALGAALAGCKGAAGDPADAGTDAPIVIRPDNGPPDPGPQDPGNPQDTATDPGKDAKDTGSRDTEDPGGEDPGEFDPGDGDPGSSDPGCIPNCTGKECGNDGCGGSCGNCPNGSCIAQECVCIPNCAGKDCGDNGCGGNCGPCTGGQCSTLGKCETAGTGVCTKTTTIACKDQSASAYNGSSNSDVLDTWPSACGSAVTPGPEKVFAFYADQSGSVTFTLTGQQSWLDLYLIEGSTCGTVGCTQASHDTVTLTAVQGTVYWIAVDATKNDAQFGPQLAIDCSWYVSTSDP